MRVRLAKQPIDPAAELAGCIEQSGGVGAVVSFVGLARPSAADGSAVHALYLDHYPGFTEASMQSIARDAAERFAGTETWIVHRCGLIRPGEPIVFVAAAAAHRRSAFEAADYLMDRLKSEAAFWKREDRENGSVWIEPTDDDRRDLERWR